MNSPESFGAWLRHRRRELDLTQDALARQVGCARITIRKLEEGKLRPSKELAALLVERLGVPSEEYENFIRYARGDRLPFRLPKKLLQTIFQFPSAVLLGGNRN